MTVWGREITIWRNEEGGTSFVVKTTIANHSKDAKDRHTDRQE